MHKRRGNGCPACLVFLLGLGCGCQSLHGYRPVPVRVEDAETNQPIAGAEVRLSYPNTQPSLAPRNSFGTTAADGIARLEAAPFGEPGPVVEVNANGYMAEEKYLTLEAVQAIPPARRSEKIEERPVCLVVRMLAEPEPTVELILPTGYRGVVRARVAIQEDMPQTPGQRCFRYEVPSSGIVEVAGPPLLRRIFATDFRARYADGATLPWQPKDSEVGLWWLRCDGDEQFFLVGTPLEYKTRRPSAPRQNASQSSSTGGSGRRHGRGGRTPADD